MKVNILDLKKQYVELKEEIESVVLDMLSSGQYIGGTQVNELEKELSEYLGVKHAITTNSGTDALVLSLKSLGIKEGDEVITTPFTFFATAEAIALVGAKPVFVDVLMDKYTMDPEKIEEKITDKTKAILPVHLFGQPAEMDRINQIAEKYDLKVIEDCCQAIGASYKGKSVGSLGTTGAFSFFPTKNLGAFGDGGLLTTNSDEIAVITKALKEHAGGKIGAQALSIINGEKEEFEKNDVDPLYNPYKYYNYLIGQNSRLDAIQAAVLRIKLKHLNKWNDMRNENARFYIQSLKDTDLIMPFNQTNENVWHQFALRTNYKQELGDYLATKEITTAGFYPVPLHLQKAFEYLGYKEGDLPNAESLSKETLCLPIYPELSKEELSYIVEQIKTFEPKKVLKK